MTPEELANKFTEYRKALSDFRKTGRISECFHHDKATCKGDIKQSHSIQRNGRLSIIEGEVNSNKVIYTFTETEFDETTSHKSLKPIGKAVASTFFGFCDYHDTILFSPIENFPFDGSSKHCFLHSYRAFAHTYHRKKEELKAYKADSNYTRLIPKGKLESMIRGAELGVADGEAAKQKLDSLIEQEDYEGLEYFIYEIPDKYPIACSSKISPYYTYRGKPLNNHTDPSIPFSEIMLTVLPDHNQTIVIFACFPDDQQGIVFLDELSQLRDIPLQKAISTILINYAENTFFAPALWNALGTAGQAQLCRELRSAASDNGIVSFPESRLNLLDPRFSARRLGIR